MILSGVGRIGRDAEVRTTQTGKSVCGISLAWNFGPKDNKQTQWVDAVMWGAQAEALGPYLLKGTLIEVTLRDVHVAEFTKGDGSQGNKLTGTVVSFDFVPVPKAEQRQQEPQQQAPQRAPQRQAAPVDDFDSDQIPF